MLKKKIMEGQDYIKGRLTFHQSADSHEGILLHAPRASRALEHAQQRGHHHVRDLQCVLVLHLP